MSAKKKHRSSNDYLQYLKGELSRQERHAFERGLEADPFEQEAMEGLESLSSVQAEQDLLSLHNRLRKRLYRRRRVAFYSVAATVASLLIVGTVFLKVHDFNPRSQESQAYPEELFETPALEEAEIQQAEAVPPKNMEESMVTDEGPDKGRIESQEKAINETKPDLEPVVEAAAEPVVEAPAELVAEPVAEPMAVEAFDFVMDEESVDEEITYMEAEQVDREGEVQAAGRRENRSSKKAQRQALEAPAQETPKMAPVQKEIEQMLTGKVTGIVISAEDQDPITGAVVMNRDIKSGVFTDLDGHFGIQVEEDSRSTLVASFVGMETQEYQVSDGAHVELVMQPDAATLDEVLVVAYVSGSEDLPTGSSFDIYQAEEEKGIEYSVPEPSIGFKSYKRYMEENIRHPQEDLSSKKSLVVLKFTVTSAGEIKDVVALRSPGISFTEEATRLLMDGPAWNPASNEEGTKDESVRMRIVFKK